MDVLKAVKERIVMKKIIIVFLAALCVFPGLSETISQKQAQQMARQFFNKATGKTVAPPKLVYNGKKLTTDRLFTPFYVYNSSTEGFVIIPADNKAFPILGFSLKDNFDPNKLSEATIALLQSYALEIEKIRYDASDISSTVSAWLNYDNFIDEVLKSKYLAWDTNISVEEAQIKLDAAYRDDNLAYADVFTPYLWQEIMEDDLANKGEIIAGLPYKGTLYPIIIHGSQGDYFRMEFTERNSWLMRINATEAIPSTMVAIVPNLVQEEDTAEEESFIFLTDILDDASKIELQRQEVSSIDVPQLGSEPMVLANGSGHFEIIMPEPVKTVGVFNFSGSLLNRQKYSENNKVYVDLLAEPSGFYILQVISDTGKSYGFKIYR